MDTVSTVIVFRVLSVISVLQCPDASILSQLDVPPDAYLYEFTDKIIANSPTYHLTLPSSAYTATIVGPYTVFSANIISPNCSYSVTIVTIFDKIILPP